MPDDDVSDLRDVVDAINKLCETMKTSYDEYEDCEDVEPVDTELVDPNTVVVEDIAEYWSEADLGVSHADLVIATPVPQNVETFIDASYTVVEPVVSTPEVIEAEPVIFETCKTDRLRYTVDSEVLTASKKSDESISRNVETFKDSLSETVNEPVMVAAEPTFEKVKINKIERKDSIDPQQYVVAKSDEVFRISVTERFEEIEPIASDVETIQCDPMSEMYYTASSEVSLLSDVDFQEKVHTEDPDKDKDDRYSVMAGHVAAMRERFESMTRTNTPCPDLMRSTSPSFEVFRNINASPDILE